jgi:hypothetical protein
VIREILIELKRHAPFTALGAITGILLLLIIIFTNTVSQVSEISYTIFYILHPTHVILSAIVTTAIYKLHRSKFNFVWGILIGYIGSIGIATLSDSIIPYLGELLLNLPNKGIHIGFIPHSGHVLISTWASLFHIIMAIGQTINPIIIISTFMFLFLAVWIPCCLSDIIFPLLFIPVRKGRNAKGAYVYKK